ncbi:MAG TPA: phosphoglycerate mutase family protein [Longimicrobium sp.]|nr:phosphoglycerate mutase family protein [Longimicrobium sp.]
MTRLARLPLLLLAFLVATTDAAAAQEEATVVILVRHAEKVTVDPNDRDPALTAAGETRARALAQALEGAGVDAVITTQFQRTRNTAKPVADALGITPAVIASGPNLLAQIAEAVRTRHAGQTVLVVGHSNSVPGTIEALGGPKVAEICESQYANLFVMVLRAGEAPTLVRSRYGAADPAPGPECAGMMAQ